MEAGHRLTRSQRVSEPLLLRIAVVHIAFARQESPKAGPFPDSWPDNAGPLCLPPNAQPLEFMLAVTRDKSQPMWRRIEAAKAAAPYRHIRIDDPFFRTLSEAQLDEVKNAKVVDNKRT
jgi:hypothetical protein